ncbi:hypothetical protein Tco_0803665 [Tanacetum coccineum]|uniref:Uncharacterized protein n=1 Tax=Tanacetum coccineum TaxID=301880 RepID=A0ABQ5A5Z0_9ASTR
MEEKETMILPTVQDKWVSLHQSFGLVCWCDDGELEKEFQNLNNVNFLCLGNLTTEEKVSALFRRLGISSLSEFRNLLDDSLIIMRKEAVGNGIVNVYTRKDKLTWFVESRKLKSSHICEDVETTEISAEVSKFSLPSLRFLPLVEVYKFLPAATSKLKKFLLELGVTGFCGNNEGSTVTGYDSQDYALVVDKFPSKLTEKSVNLLKVLDTLWDDYSSDKLTAFSSSMDDQLHFPYELFHNCEAVHAVLGDNKPYCIPKVSLLKFIMCTTARDGSATLLIYAIFCHED